MMALRFAMVRFFTLFPAPSMRSKTFLHHQCLSITKGKLEPTMKHDKVIGQSRKYAEGPGTTKGPEKEEQIEKIKMPGFVHPHTQNEEGYFTQKAHQQLEELKKKMEKPVIDNTEKKD